MADDLLENAAQMGVKVIRAWAFNAIGSLTIGREKEEARDRRRDLVPSVNPERERESFFQYWDEKTGSSKVNEGENGIQRLDYAVKAAKERGMRLLLVLTNNWGEYGGAAQYNLWHNASFHDDFFSSEKTREEYKKWVSFLLNRVNPLTNVRYKDEPAIFGWELINEIRCQGCVEIGTCPHCKDCKKARPVAPAAVASASSSSSSFRSLSSPVVSSSSSSSSSSSAVCTTEKTTKWVEEMAAFVHSLDANHLVGVGDEGFLHSKERNEWGYDGREGDHEALVSLSSVDFAMVHTYPNNWQRDAAWISGWVDDHLKIGQRLDKPVLFEEFGWMRKGGEDTAKSSLEEERETFLDGFTSQVCKGKGFWMFWMLAAKERDTGNGEGTLYPDYDKFTIYYKDGKGKVTPSGQKMASRIEKSDKRQC